MSVIHAPGLLVSVQESTSPQVSGTFRLVPAPVGPALPFRVQAIELAYPNGFVPVAATSESVYVPAPTSVEP